MRPLSVAICTHQRASITTALASLVSQELPPTRIIVVDNDDTMSAKDRVLECAAQHSLPVDYVHAPGHNIALARNAALNACQGGLLAFMDDDEIATPPWLSHLYACLRPNHAAAFGPVIATYPDHAPRWMKELSPHNQTVWYTRGMIRTGYTGNCLIDLDHPAFRGASFDASRQHHHGEDTLFFKTAFDAGARYAFSPEAIIYEPVPQERMSFEWLVARRFAMGQAFSDVNQRAGVAAMGLSLGKAFGAGLVGKLTGQPAKAAALRAAFHRGAAAGARRPPLESRTGQPPSRKKG